VTTVPCPRLRTSRCRSAHFPSGHAERLTAQTSSAAGNLTVSAIDRKGRTPIGCRVGPFEWTGASRFRSRGDQRAGSSDAKSSSTNRTENITGVSAMRLLAFSISFFALPISPGRPVARTRLPPVETAAEHAVLMMAHLRCCGPKIATPHASPPPPLASVCTRAAFPAAERRSASSLPTQFFRSRSVPGARRARRGFGRDRRAHFPVETLIPGTHLARSPTTFAVGSRRRRWSGSVEAFAFHDESSRQTARPRAIAFRQSRRSSRTPGQMIPAPICGEPRTSPDLRCLSAVLPLLWAERKLQHHGRRNGHRHHASRTATSVSTNSPGTDGLKTATPDRPVRITTFRR